MNEQPKDQEIRQMLIQLHNELEQTQTVDEDEKAMLQHLMNDIQEMLNRSNTRTGTGYKPGNNLIDRLEESIDVLEVSHPTLTAMITKAMETLNIAGI